MTLRRLDCTLLAAKIFSRCGVTTIFSGIKDARTTSVQRLWQNCAEGNMQTFLVLCLLFIEMYIELALLKRNKRMIINALLASRGIQRKMLLG